MAAANGRRVPNRSKSADTLGGYEQGTRGHLWAAGSLQCWHLAALARAGWPSPYAAALASLAITRSSVRVGPEMPLSPAAIESLDYESPDNAVHRAAVARRTRQSRWAYAATKWALCFLIGMGHMPGHSPLKNNSTHTERSRFSS